MNEPDHEKLAEMLHTIAGSSPEEREEMIRIACGSNESICREIESLLRHESNANTLFSEPWLDRGKLFAVDETEKDFAIPQFDGFEVLRAIGYGASGVVYLAQQRHPHRLVAIKVLRAIGLSDAMTDRMVAEAHLLAQLEHPSITRIYEAGVLREENWDRPYLVMEYVDGVDLAGYLRDAKPSIDCRLHLFTSVCEAVGYAHSRGIVHRDLKPANILISSKGSGSVPQIKLIDFGIAKIIGRSAIPVDIQTADHSRLGTLRYMSPERVNGTSKGGSVHSDVYSLGMLARDLFMPADEQIGSHPRVTPRQRQVLRRAIARMTHDEPEKRSPSASAAAQTIRSALMQERHRWRISPLLSCSLLIPIVAAVAIYSLWQGDHKGLGQSPQDTPLREIAFEGAMLQTVASPDTPASATEAENTILRFIQYAGSLAIDGHLAESLEYHDRIQKLLHTDMKLSAFVIAQAHVGHGYALLKSDRIELAHKAYLLAEAAIDLDTVDEENHMAETLCQVAHGLQSCGDHGAARRYYRFLMDHERFDHWQWALRAKILGNAGGLEWLGQNYDEAEQLLTKSIQHPPQTPCEKVQLEIARLQASLAVVLRARSAFEESDRLLQSALSRHVAIRSPTDPAARRYMQHLATNRLLQGDYETAMNIAESTRKLWQGNSHPDQQERAYCDFVIGSASLGLNRVQPAIEHLTMAYEETLGTDLNAQRLRARIETLLTIAEIASRTPHADTRYELSLEQLRGYYGSEHAWYRFTQAQVSIARNLAE